jgi:hypothetical protein
MIRLLVALLMVVAGTALTGCGGGGGGGGTTGITATGRVVWLSTGGPPTPPATVTIGGTSASTRSDGTFELSVPSGSTTVRIDFQPNAGAPVTFQFTVAPITADRDLGDFYIGPETVAVAGQLVSSVDGSPVSGAVVQFARLTATTDSDGRFRIEGVPYDSQNTAAFLGIVGSATRAGFFDQTFRAENPAQGGVVDVGTITLVPGDEGDIDGTPYNVEGFVTPANRAAGTVITLLQGGTPVRQFTVGSNGRFIFWVEPGQYVLRAHNPTNGMSAPDQNVTVTTTNGVVRVDVALQ